MKFSKLFLILVLCVTSACQTSVRHKTNYADNMSEGSMMVVIPKVYAHTVDIAGNRERMYNYEYFLEPIIQEKLSTELEEKGYEVSFLRKEDLKKDDLYKDIDLVVEHHIKQTNGMFATAMQKEDLAFNTNVTLKDEAKTLSEKLGHKIAVVSVYRENIKTDGARAVGFAMDIGMAALGVSTGGQGSMTENSGLRVSFIDLETAEFIWANQSADQASLLFDGVANLTKDDKEIAEGKVTATVKRALKALPDKSKLFDDQEIEQEDLAEQAEKVSLAE